MSQCTCYSDDIKLARYSLPQDDNWLAGFSLLAKDHLAFDLSIYDHQLTSVIDLAKRFPDTSIIIEHLAWPTAFSKSDFEQWRDHLNQIARCDQVSIKLSGKRNLPS